MNFVRCKKCSRVCFDCNYVDLQRSFWMYQKEMPSKNGGINEYVVPNPATELVDKNDSVVNF